MNFPSYLLVASILLAPLLGMSQPDEPRDHYQLHIQNSPQPVVQVTATIALSDSLLSMSNYGPIPERWPHYVDHMQAFDANNNPIQLSKRDSTAWLVPLQYVGETIQISYRVRMEHENEKWPGGIDGVAFVRDWGIMASGRSLFVINPDTSKSIEVAIHVPDHWKATTPWVPETSGSNSYTVSNQLQLLESLMFFGTHEEVVMKRDSFQLHFVLGGSKIASNTSQYTETANAVLDYYIEMMGGLPKPAPGQDLSRIVVMINETSETVDGEVIGNHISVLLNPDAPPQEQIIGWFLFAHEFFHLWNGKSLRFQDTKTDWFKEGISNYYTLKALYQASIVNEEIANQVLSGLFYKRYVNDPGYGELAPSEAASGFDKDNHWGLIYGGGLFAGICMDLQIRQDTQNEASLDDLMRYFYTTAAGTKTLIGNDDLLRKLNSLGTTDFTQFLSQCIHGSQAVPLKDYFVYAGIDVSVADNQLNLNKIDNPNEFQQALWSGFLGKME